VSRLVAMMIGGASDLVTITSLRDRIAPVSSIVIFNYRVRDLELDNIEPGMSKFSLAHEPSSGKNEQRESELLSKNAHLKNKHGQQILIYLCQMALYIHEFGTMYRLL
jgi:hypothetical protein